MTVADPYAVLSLPANADDAAIRARYLELVQAFPPEQHPKKFAAIRTAYESIKSFDVRIRRRLFPDPASDSIDAMLEDLAGTAPRPRLGLTALLAATFPAVK